MDAPPPLDNDRRARMLRNIGIAAFTVTLGSCGGMALGHYTVTGMAPFGEAPAPAYVDAAEEATVGEWIDTRAETREAIASRY